jgi:hypothetical protein
VGHLRELASCHPSGAYNFEVTIFSVNMYTHAINKSFTACITEYYILATYWMPWCSPKTVDAPSVHRMKHRVHVRKLSLINKSTWKTIFSSRVLFVTDRQNSNLSISVSPRMSVYGLSCHYQLSNQHSINTVHHALKYIFRRNFNLLKNNLGDPP